MTTIKQKIIDSESYGKVNRKLKAMIVLRYETQEDFAVVVGERRSVISGVVRGRRRISPAKQLEWATALGCRPVDLFPKDSKDE